MNRRHVRTRLIALLAAAAACAAHAPADGPAETGGVPFVPEAERLPLPKDAKPAGEVSERHVLASETSALIYWQTANRARSYVEYGETAEYGRKTDLSAISWVVARPYHTQVHRVTGLKPDATYHYRTVSVGTDGQAARGPDRTFRTKKHADAVRLPGDLKGPPYVLDKPGATYVLTKDVTAPRCGFIIQADGVTLDLDGHTVVYNQQAVQFPNNTDWPGRSKGPDPVFGILIRGPRKPVRILNGRIVQGKGNSAGTVLGIGCNPIYASGPPAGTEIGGVELVWTGRDISGMYLHWGSAHVHHCVFDDRGRGITNRHQAISSVDGNGGSLYDHNLVKATRQQGLVCTAGAVHNEVYINSYCTNSFAFKGKRDLRVEIAHNRVFGCGEHPVAIAMMGAFKPGTKVHHNHTEVMCTRSGKEYGWTGSACFRTTWGGDWLDVYENTFIGYAKTRRKDDQGRSGKTRVLWVGLPKFKTSRRGGVEIADGRGTFHHNRIIARGLDATAKAAAIAVVCLNTSPNLIFHHNTVRSTWGDVMLSDEYGHADGYPKFVENTFEREGKSPAFVTIRQEYSGRPATGVFLGNTFAKGTARDDVKLQAGGRVVCQRRVQIGVTDAAGVAVAGAEVVVTDAAGKEVFRGRTAAADTPAGLLAGPEAVVLTAGAKADSKTFICPVTVGRGMAEAVLTESVRTPKGTTTAGAYTVKVSKDGKTATARLKAGADRLVVKLPIAAAGGADPADPAAGYVPIFTPGDTTVEARRDGKAIWKLKVSFPVATVEIRGGAWVIQSGDGTGTATVDAATGRMLSIKRQ